MKILDTRILVLVGIIVLALLFTTANVNATCPEPCIDYVTVGIQGMPLPGNIYMPGTLNYGTPGSVRFPVNIFQYMPSAGTGMTVDFTLDSTLPMGATTSFSSNNIWLDSGSHSGWVVLTIFANNHVPAGSYTFKVKAFNNGSLYDFKTVTGTLKIDKSLAEIIWYRRTLQHGIPLSSEQLDATTSIPGTFLYTPAAGTILDLGTQTLHVEFIPEDTANYEIVSKDIMIDIVDVIPTPTTTQPPGTVMRGSSFGIIGIVALIGCLVVIGMSRLRMNKK